MYSLWQSKLQRLISKKQNINDIWNTKHKWLSSSGWLLAKYLIVATKSFHFGIFWSLVAAGKSTVYSFVSATAESAYGCCSRRGKRRGPSVFQSFYSGGSTCSGCLEASDWLKTDALFRASLVFDATRPSGHWTNAVAHMQKRISSSSLSESLTSVASTGHRMLSWSQFEQLDIVQNRRIAQQKKLFCKCLFWVPSSDAPNDKILNKTYHDVKNTSFLIKFKVEHNLFVLQNEISANFF